MEIREKPAGAARCRYVYVCDDMREREYEEVRAKENGVRAPEEEIQIPEVIVDR